MTVDPGQDWPIGNRVRMNELARPLTLDQAYAKAYANMRHLLKLSLDVIKEDEVRHALDRAMKAWEMCLEVELTRLFYSEEVAKVLARPE